MFFVQILEYTFAGLLASLALFVFLNSQNLQSTTPVPETRVPILTLQTESTTTPTAIEEDANVPEESATTTGTDITPAEEPAATVSTSTEESAESDRLVQRIENPYSSPPFSVEELNEKARASLVNIVCYTGTGDVRPITGSGTVIGERGVILTNAHVAQYLLLTETGKVNLQCLVRAGAPARDAWKVKVLYIPPVWVEKNAKDLTLDRPKGTGESDYALLYITESVNGSPLPSSFSALQPDTREGIGFTDDAVMAASYPAEFLKSGSARSELYPLTSIAVIKKLLTLGSGSIDLISVGGVPGAQSGSSGGPIVNPWGYVVGVITTTSEGATTAERDLHALSMYYVDRDIKAQSGFGLNEYIFGNAAELAADFNAREVSRLQQLLLDQLD